MSVVGESLLTALEAAARLGISKSTFHKFRAKLCANGLRFVTYQGEGEGKTKRYLASSIDRMIDRAARKEIDLF